MKRPVVLTVTRWAVNDGLVSVIVRNDGSRTIIAARAIVSARDSHGNVLGATSAPIGARCCTVTGLAPGKRVGLYIDLGNNADRAKSVSVQYADVRTKAHLASAPFVSARNVSLRTTSTTATVTATLTLHGSGGPYISAQAVLQSSSGKLVSLISGGFYCFEANSTRTVHLQLFHPVPNGTRVTSVLGFTLDKFRGVGSDRLPTCSAAGH